MFSQFLLGNYRSRMQVRAYEHAAMLRPLMRDYNGGEIQCTSACVHRQA